MSIFAFLFVVIISLPALFGISDSSALDAVDIRCLRVNR